MTRTATLLIMKNFIKLNNKEISRQCNHRNIVNNQYHYFGFVNAINHLEMQMDLYMSKIYSQISLQAIKFYSKTCEQTRSLRQLTLTQVHKDTPLLGYILTGDHSIILQDEGINVMIMYKCARKVSPVKVETILHTISPEEIEVDNWSQC